VNIAPARHTDFSISKMAIKMLGAEKRSSGRSFVDINQWGRPAYVGFWRIVLQKSKVASVRIFGETLKREAIDDSYYLSRATEVAYEFSVRR
jgi:hypothetical protein